MVSEEGGRRAEWVGKDGEKEKSSVWVWWRRPEEWAEVISGWVESTGQKGTVLTLYELGRGAGSVGQGMFALCCCSCSMAQVPGVCMETDPLICT